MKFLTSGEQLLPGGFAHSTVSVQAIAALEPLNSGGSPGAELSVRADLLPQRVELLLDEPDGAAGQPVEFVVCRDADAVRLGPVPATPAEVGSVVDL